MLWILLDTEGLLVQYCDYSLLWLVSCIELNNTGLAYLYFEQ
jgi:hypothetical protein